MAGCPVCNSPEIKDLKDLLDRIDDPNAIVSLACDFAEHVFNATSPPMAVQWLQVVRMWQNNPCAAEEVREQAEEAAWSVKEVSPQEGVWAIEAAAAAVEFASDGDMGMLIGEAGKAAGSAVVAAQRFGDEEAEHAWQMDYVRALLCTCVVIPAITLPEDRSRISSLAH